MPRASTTRIIVISTCILFFGTCFSSMSTTQIISQSNLVNSNTLEGNILFAPMNSYTTYLIDNTGTVNHTWSTSYIPGTAAYWYDDGSILRTIHLATWGGGSGGGMQQITWDGTII